MKPLLPLFPFPSSSANYFVPWRKTSAAYNKMTSRVESGCPPERFTDTSYFYDVYTVVYEHQINGISIADSQNTDWAGRKNKGKTTCIVRETSKPNLVMEGPSYRLLHCYSYTMHFAHIICSDALPAAQMPKNSYPTGYCISTVGTRHPMQDVLYF